MFSCFPVYPFRKHEFPFHDLANIYEKKYEIGLTFQVDNPNRLIWLRNLILLHWILKLRVLWRWIDRSGKFTWNSYHHHQEKKWTQKKLSFFFSSSKEILKKIVYIWQYTTLWIFIHDSNSKIDFFSWLFLGLHFTGIPVIVISPKRQFYLIFIMLFW